MVWGFIGSYFLIRYILRKHPLSMFIASMPMGFAIANALYLHILPRWLAAPFLFTTDIWATLMVVFIVRDIRIKHALMAEHTQQREDQGL